MADTRELLRTLEQGGYDAALAELYAPDGDKKRLARARERAMRMVRALEDNFTVRDGAALFTAPGRTELGGNHTDHQHGRVLCGSVDLDMLACAAPNGGRVVRILSEGYPLCEVDLTCLEPVEAERNTSAALVRGVAARITALGYPVGGFDACITSDVLAGSGLSSSAAYEVLLGNIMNHFFCGGALDAVELAKIGQWAENNFFGKPCGLMDQTGCSVGGAVAIDFADPAAPVITRAEYDFARSGHAMCIVDTVSAHADLTDDYANITREMGAAAAFFGKTVLRDVPEETFRAALPEVRERCGDRAVLRALHYYQDDRRAAAEAQALEQGDFERFLALVNASGRSSAVNLQNTWSISDPRSQAIPVALTLAEELLDGTGAVRVHGGGFAGTIQAFVPEEKLESFRAGMERVFGEGTCHILHIRSMGGGVIAG